MPDIIKAVDILKQGGLVAMPTETVYGLAADALKETAVDKIFKIKERPYHHPLIVHIAHQDQLSAWARDIPEAAWELVQAFWPGPLTLILKKQPHVSDKITGGQETIGLRIPRHPVAQALLQTFGSGVAAPSANKFTHISPTTAEAVRQEFGDDIDIILDGGHCEVGLESTIVDLTHGSPVILRPGMITAKMLENVLKTQVDFSKNSVVRAPGSHHLHYAPVTSTFLIATKDIPEFLKTFSEKELPAALVTHHTFPVPSNLVHVQLSSDAKSYAHDIYRALRELDNQHFHKIYIEKVPESVEWDAVRDRLSKACR